MVRGKRADIAKILAILTVMAYIGVMGLITPVVADNAQKGVILISWDGVQKDTLQTLLSEGRLGNLSSILEKGSFINMSYTDHYADTTAAHAEMLTGYPPEITGIYKSMRYKEIPKDLTLFERLESFFGQENISTVIIASKEKNMGTYIGLPFYQASKVVDYYHDQDGDARLTGAIATEAVYYYAKDKPFFIFINLKDADEAGHSFSSSSPQYTQGIINDDRGTGMILQALQEMGIGDKADILITTDHGFRILDQEINGDNDIWMITNKPGYNLTGDQKDIVPTIFHDLGVDYTSMKPSYPGQSLREN